jgi:hypothetical protein
VPTTLTRSSGRGAQHFGVQAPESLLGAAPKNTSIRFDEAGADAMCRDQLDMVIVSRYGAAQPSDRVGAA